MSRYAIAAETLDTIAALGFAIYQNPDPQWQSYLYFTDGKNIGYLQSDIGGWSLSTVHIPNRNSGTGYGMSERGDPPVEMTRESLARAFCMFPDWASGPDRASTKKYDDIAAFLADPRHARIVKVRDGLEG